VESPRILIRSIGSICTATFKGMGFSPPPTISRSYAILASSAMATAKRA
jgi:hypothetical protein